MKAVEIRGFFGMVLFIAMALGTLILAITIPSTVTWVTWNAIIGELFRGPMIHFWQAIILTTIIGIVVKLIFQPQINFQFKRVTSAEELEELRKRYDKDSHKPD
jgi:hypothetical protein